MPTAGDQLDTTGPLNSALVGSTGPATSDATIAADAISRVVVLFTEKVGIDEVEAEAALTDAAPTGVAALPTAASARNRGVEQRQHDTRRQQLCVLPIEQGKVQYVRH
jgi:hypothetical protein